MAGRIVSTDEVRADAEMPRKCHFQVPDDIAEPLGIMGSNRKETRGVERSVTVEQTDENIRPPSLTECGLRTASLSMSLPAYAFGPCLRDVRSCTYLCIAKGSLTSHLDVVD